MRISQGCIQQVAGVAFDGTIKDAAETMRKRPVGSFCAVDGSPVAGLGKASIGLRTDRHIGVAAIARGILPDVMTVGDLMQLPLHTLDEDAYLVDAMRRMGETAVRGLVDTDRAGAMMRPCRLRETRLRRTLPGGRP